MADHDSCSASCVPSPARALNRNQAWRRAPVAMAGKANRRVCSFCSEELAPTAFYRHLHDRTRTICHGKRKKIDANTSDGESECLPHLGSPRATDSTFDLESDDEDEIWHDDQACEVLSPLSRSTPRNSSESLSCDDSTSSASSSLEEVWDETGGESDTGDSSAGEKHDSVTTVVSGISIFLVFFHLIYHLSERAITTLLGFIRTLIHYLAVVTGYELLQKIVHALPKTLHAVRAALKHNDYVEYVVCPKCSILYSPAECVIINCGQEESKRCTFIEFPNHPHPRRRNACNEILMKQIKIGGKYKFVPRKAYIYRSVVCALKDMARRKGFLQRCDHWRTRVNEGMMGDVYDGKLWSELSVINGRPFLELPNNLCLSLNIDWFNPYEETPYSVGAIYLAVLNLPRDERFKEENVILVGLIPGPNEPKQHINTFLSPLVYDLQVLYEGVTFPNPSAVLGLTTLRATLACIACDLPATRRVCGFSSFNATFGCSKCMKMFETSSFGSKPVYGGFDCEDWTARDMTTHKCKAQEYQEARTSSERSATSRQCGIKYSELLLISELNIIRYHIIDPMHCIFLGLAKHTIQIWKDKGILQSTQFSLLQDKVDSIVPPSKIGRIPRKIQCSFMSFTADEWKNWILIYSIFALHGIVTGAHFNCWCLLVSSCCLFCQPIISSTHIERGHTLLVQFCKEFERLYGSDACTPNMHMACHLKDCMLDYGPLASFWCFPYERYNGILEGISKSWISPEKQMFLKFLGMQ